MMKLGYLMGNLNSIKEVNSPAETYTRNASSREVSQGSSFNLQNLMHPVQDDVKNIQREINTIR